MVFLTSAGPLTISKPYSKEISKIADFWLCATVTPSLKILLTTSVADDGKFLELQFPLTVKEEALKLALYLGDGLEGEIQNLSENSKAGERVKLPNGYSVSFSKRCPTSPDQKAIVIRATTGAHAFKADNYDTAQNMILTIVKGVGAPMDKEK